MPKADSMACGLPPSLSCIAPHGRGSVPFRSVRFGLHCVYIYIYVYIERERYCIYREIHMYIYIYSIERERDFLSGARFEARAAQENQTRGTEAGTFYWVALGV